uniref:(northern house mosquito) hypothetical protein n=1 Tax=Culex pipiens TaxID=7175 RepID=A0A8D8F911_CULPI
MSKLFRKKSQHHSHLHQAFFLHRLLLLNTIFLIGCDSIYCYFLKYFPVLPTLRFRSSACFFSQFLFLFFCLVRVLKNQSQFRCDLLPIYILCRRLSSSFFSQHGVCLVLVMVVSGGR